MYINIKKLSPIDQLALNEWYSCAINDPTVAPWLGDGRWSECPTAPTNDWDKAYYMDGAGRGLLRLSFNRGNESVSMMLHVLACADRERIAGLLLRKVFTSGAIAGARWIEFVISAANEKWLATIQKRYHMFEWGVCPYGFFKSDSNEDVRAHNFCIPIACVLGGIL